MVSSPTENDPLWPLTWEAVEDAQLRDSLRLSPAQRLAWAEALLEFIQLASKHGANSLEVARTPDEISRKPQTPGSKP